MIHSVITTSYNANPSDSFLPLTVEYRLRSYAYGVLPSSKSRRERHGSEEETLVARIVDRSIRPLFVKGYVDNVQVTATLHSADNINDPVSACVNATSMAIMKANLPWNGPVGCKYLVYLSHLMV